MTPNPQHKPSGIPVLWKSIATLLTLVIVLCVWGSCTVTKNNYATLSFLFDGVPNPDATAGGPPKPGDSTLATAVVVHLPFKEEKCEACHKTQYRPSRNDPSACLTCHKGVADQHAWTHGAVAGGACLWCHAPHESSRKFLLRNPDRKLCMQCHSATMMNGKEVPAHVDEKVGCLECHFGHGGTDAKMLKPGATAQAPPPPSMDSPTKEVAPAGSPLAPTQQIPPVSPSSTIQPGSGK